MDTNSPEFLAAREAAMAKYTGWIGHDATDPTGPSGHAYGLAVSTRLTSYYRQTHRKDAMDIKPQQVIDCIVQAGIKDWVLMGLHGYVGYLPMPRATQDVDIMVPYSAKNKAVKALAAQWPELLVVKLPQVVRFMDAKDLDSDGKPKPVIDLMLPWGKFQVTILKEFVIIDEKTGNRLPMIEAAIVAKYAAIVSPHRDWDKKQQDAVDVRRIIKANIAAIDRERLVRLANEVWEGGGDEILQFLKKAMQNEPF
jgi:hypothetical protein